MIRFCDRAVYCVAYEQLDRRELLSFFFRGSRDEIVCVLNPDGSYRGRITYYSLINCDRAADAVLEDCAVLDQNLWEDARYFFRNYKNSYGEHVLLPIVDAAGRLVCFAYEDYEANRELRMLRELTETHDALQFCDIYPQYRCVKINGFNELACVFAEYLKNLGINVQVAGTMWQGFFPEAECLTPDYECLELYSEGVAGKKKNHAENLLKSASVEFECVDRIYEANLKEGRIRNADEDWTALLKRIKGQELIILGTGRASQDAYDFLLSNGLEIACFVEEICEEQSHKMFGKQILSRIDAEKLYRSPVFIDCVSKNSAWGMGETDFYDSLGYKRNDRFLLLNDYIEIPQENLLHTLKEIEVVLAGDAWLCRRLSDYLQSKEIRIAGYLDIWEKGEEVRGLKYICIENVTEDMMCMCVVPALVRDKRSDEGKQKIELKQYLRENGVKNYSDYFSEMLPFLSVEEDNGIKYCKKELRPCRIIVGSIESGCGNYFFKGLLDGHPSVLLISTDCCFNSNLFWYCIRLSLEEAADILPVFWKLYDNEDSGILKPSVFNEKMERLLSRGGRFTSQELFVMFHMAYMYMCGREIPKTEINHMIIYWEPHGIRRELVENCARWLGAEDVLCDIFNMVRNICMRNGSLLRGILKLGWEHSVLDIYARTLSYPPIDKDNFRHCERTVVKFEDLKCEPKETLSKICGKWGIEWSDSLMKTTYGGKSLAYHNGESDVSDFDLGPVYNTNETYFSEFDRLRIMMICAPWQRKYGYPYVELSEFSRRELQELFSKRFRFEKFIKYDGSRLLFDLRLQGMIRRMLWKTRMLEIQAHDQTAVQVCEPL